MTVHENCEDKIRSLLACINAHEQSLGDTRDELYKLKGELKRAENLIKSQQALLESERAATAEVRKREEQLKGWQLEAMQAKGDSKALREALAKAATVFEGYACHHFLKNADDKAQANRQHAKMCRDALAESEEKP